MAVWTVFEHDRFETDAKIAEKARFVRDGFSCLAFLFGPLWLLANGMIVVLIGYLVVVGAANFAAVTYLGEQGAFLVSLVIMVWFGFEATGLKRWALARRGWRLAGVVEARRRIEAERRWYEGRLAAPEPEERAAPAYRPMPWGPSPDQPVLGLFPEGPR